MRNPDIDANYNCGACTEVQEKVRLAAEVFDKHSDVIRSTIRFNVKDKSKADDIFQDFFVSLVHKPIPPNIQDIRGYIYKAVTNDIIDVSRRTKGYQDRIQRYAECCKYGIIEGSPQDIVIQAEETAKMFRLIESQLPKREAEVVVQRYGHDLSTAETARKMCVNKRSVSRYLSIALKKMRQFVCISDTK